jgi:hypothetical protein
MLRINLKKLKPSFGGVGADSHDDDDDEEEDRTDGTDQVHDAETTNQPTEGETEEETQAIDEEEREEHDIHEMLDNLQIPDFNMSVDFESAEEAEEKGGGGIDYDGRITREEVYSRRYHPDEGEREELQRLATVLGESPSSFRLTSSATTLQDLLFGNHSIILKKGPVSSREEECDLYILTDGFILVYQNISPFNPLGGRYEACHYWTAVDYVDTAKAGRLLLQMRSGESYELYATTGGDGVQGWFEAIEAVALQHMVRDREQAERTRTFGWQHAVMRRPGFTAAVTGDMRLMGNPRDRLINDLDRYNQSAPLHYAMQHEPCNAEMVDALLRLGSDPNLPDGEGRSAMYFARRSHLDDIEAMLVENGGKASRLAEMEMRGELFGGVEQAQRRTEQRRENEKAVKDQKAAEAVARAGSAQSEMSRNLQAMMERGEKIEEMDDKARQIRDQAKEYGEMAAQLKNQIKKKKWYHL